MQKTKTNFGKVLWADNEEELVSFLAKAGRRDIVIAPDKNVIRSVLTRHFATISRRMITSLPKLIITDVIQAVERAKFMAVFERFLSNADDTTLLDRTQLREALLAANRNELFIATRYVEDFDCIVFFTGTFEQTVVPRIWFDANLERVDLDLKQASLIDYGQTVVFGNIEIAVDAILYDFDSNFRREAKRRRRNQDESIGGSIRRLRLQRGLRQGEFQGISRKEIGRIERGEVRNPHQKTLLQIADHLGVALSDLESY